MTASRVVEWPSFPASLLEAPAEDWGSLPSIETTSWPITRDCYQDCSYSRVHALVRGTAEREREEKEEMTASSELLADLDEAFATAQGDQDRAKILRTIQVFLAIRKVRLIEDLLLLTVSLRSDKQGGRDHARNFSNASTIERQNQLIAGKHSAIVTAAAGSSTGEDDDSVMELRRELQEALKRLPLPGNPSNAEISHSLIDENRGTTSSSTDQQAGVTQREGFLMGEGSVCEEGLRAAAESSSDAFFETWADRFRTMSVPLGKAPGADGGGTGGGQGTVDDGEEGGHIHQRKDDREIQAARDVERDTLRVNGVFVKGSEGYAAVVGRVKRELGRIAEPVTGSDAPLRRLAPSGEGHNVRGGPGGGDYAGMETPARKGDSRSPPQVMPLRPNQQLENFSKLVLKAANRTESGGLAFDAINRVMELCPGACDGSVLVVPDSSKAEPLGITIVAEGFTQTGGNPFGLFDPALVPELRNGLHAFGIAAYVEAATVYSLYSADMEKIHLRLRAVFRSSLRLAISPFVRATCEAFSDVGYRGDKGIVEIEVIQGSHESGY